MTVSAGHAARVLSGQTNVAMLILNTDVSGDFTKAFTRD